MYKQGKFGIEYTPLPPKPEGSWVGRVLFVAALVVILLVIRAIVKRISAPRAEDHQVQVLSPGPREDDNLHSTTATSNDNANAITVDTSHRPTKVRNLLLRLAAAERRGDVEMAVTTIERLRDTPGADDLDDKLARRLGTLNMRRLFELKNGQWTIPVTVRRGDSATRIAYEHGSTLASFAKLNDVDVDRLAVGQKVVVMNHPRFQLVVTRRTHIADLSLNGKFFKRYDLTGEVAAPVGSYATPERLRAFCAEKGIGFKPLDRAELEMLLPKGTAVFVKDV